MPEPIAVVICVGLSMCVAPFVRTWPAFFIATAIVYVGSRFIAAEMGLIGAVGSGAYFPTQAWFFEMLGQLLFVWLLSAAVFWVSRRVRGRAVNG